MFEIVDSFDIDNAETLNRTFKEGKGIKVDSIDMVFLSKESIKDYSFLIGVADSEGLLGYWCSEIDKLRKFLLLTSFN